MGYLEYYQDCIKNKQIDPAKSLARQQDELDKRYREIADLKDKITRRNKQIKVLQGKLQKQEENGLYEICEMVHSSCDSECPVFAVNNCIPDTVHNFDVNRGCDCFKNGKAMKDFLEKNNR